MRRPLFTSENTEPTEKNKSSFTTETRRHRGRKGDRIKRAFEGRHKPRDLITKFSLCLCVAVVNTFAVFSVRSVFSVVTLSLALLLMACSPKPDPNTLVMIIESSP